MASEGNSFNIRDVRYEISTLLRNFAYILQKVANKTRKQNQHSINSPYYHVIQLPVICLRIVLYNAFLLLHWPFIDILLVSESVVCTARRFVLWELWRRMICSVLLSPLRFLSSSCNDVFRCFLFLFFLGC